jgi:hypothetical protein
MVGMHRRTRGDRRPPFAGRQRFSVLAIALAAGALAAAVILPASASAAAPIALDAPDNGSPPLIAFDPSTQTTYVAWANPHSPYGVELCVLPAGAAGCEGGAPVLLSDSSYPGAGGSNSLGFGGLVVLPGGETVVIGTPVATGSVAWASAAGGAAFLTASQGLQNGGNFISPVSLFYTFNNAVALNGTDVALLDDYADDFSDSPFAGPESPAIPTSNSNPPPASNPGAGSQYTRKSEFTDGPEVAAEPAPPPAAPGTDIVVGVGTNESGADLTPAGCVNYAATGYGVSVGSVSGSSNGAGTLNGEGLPAYGLLACSAEAPVLAQGGTDGIGVVEEEGSEFDGVGSTIGIYYHAFAATATGGTFGPGVELGDVTHLTLDGVNTLDLSEDSGTGVYATWPDSNGLQLDYSPNGGTSWGGPVVVPPPANSAGQGDQVVVGTGGGNAEIAFDGSAGSGDQVYVQSVNYQTLATPPPAADTISTSQTAGSATGASITVPAGTVGETDRAAVSGTAASAATGTMSYTLYSASSCSAASAVFHGGTTTVTGGLAAASAPVTVALAKGKYYWQAVYSGNTANVAGASACGSEVLSVVTATSSGGSGSSNGTTVTVTITCAVTPCTITITITGDPPATTASAARVSADKKKKPKPKIITLAKGTFKITKRGSHKLGVKLTKAGKKFLASHPHYKGAKLLVSTKVDSHVEKTSRTITITTHKPKKHKKK